MRFRKMADGDVGEASSRRHLDPESGREEINITDQDLAATPPLEEEPEFSDILPDQIHEFRRDDDEADDREVTARPSESLRPIPPEDLPRG
jgi:hypothetical protein